MTPLTLKQHLEAIRDASCEEYQSPETVPSFEVIRLIYSHAEAALAILNFKPLDEEARHDA